jgi:cytochrome c oxidase cbb3-type subunit 4
MDISHDVLVALSKSWGLFYLIAFSVIVVAYTFWPGNRARFDAAKKSILDQDDKPWR